MSSALQLDRRLRWSLYAAFALLFATGAAWLLADQLKDSADGEFWQATIANVLMVHGGVAMLTLLLLGALFPIHIARAWRGRLNRVSGSIMVTLQRRADPNRVRPLLFGRRDAAPLGERRAHRGRFCTPGAHCLPHLAWPAAPRVWHLKNREVLNRALGMRRLLNLNDVIRLLRSEVKRAGSQRALRKSPRNC